MQMSSARDFVPLENLPGPFSLAQFAHLVWPNGADGSPDFPHDNVRVTAESPSAFAQELTPNVPFCAFLMLRLDGSACDRFPILKDKKETRPLILPRGGLGSRLVHLHG